MSSRLRRGVSRIPLVGHESWSTHERGGYTVQGDSTSGPSILDALDEPALVVGFDGTIRAMNAAARALGDDAATTYVGGPSTAIRTEPLVSALRAATRCAAEPDFVPPRTLFGPLHDGRRAVLALRIAQIDDAGVPALLVRCREQAGAETSRDSERRFAAAFRAMPHSISVSELATGRYVDCNDAFERVSGYTRDEVIGRTSFELDLWVDPADRQELVRRMTEAGTVRDLEIRFRAKGGRVVFALCHCDVIEVDGVACFLNTFEDVSERLRVDAELRAAEEARRAAADELRLVFESSPIGLALLDASGRPFRTNASFRRFFGRSEDALAALTIPDLEHPDEASTDRAIVQALLEGRIAEVRGEKRFVDADGGTTWGRLTLSRTHGVGAAEAFVLCMVEDANARRAAEAALRRSEEQLRQAQKLEALGTLAGGIAHDFNNILTASLNFTELAIARAEEPAAVRELLAQVDLANTRAQGLVRQILAFSGRQQQIRRPISLEAIASEALRLLESTLPKLVRFEVRFDADTPRVLADPTQVHQIVMNLCTNAAHAIGPRQGTIGVRLERIAPGDAAAPLDRSRAYARLTVSDDGRGMDEDTLRQVFDPFFTTKAPGEGTGLGLSVVHGIVVDHGGTIDVASDVGVGTVMRILLPADVSDVDDVVVIDGAPPNGRGLRVFLVDDEVAISDSARIALERFGFHVTTENDPAMALVTFLRDPAKFDAFVTDFAMPHLTGLDLAERVLAIRPELPVLLMSGYHDDRRAESIRRAGIAALLDKPVSFSALARAILRTADGQPA